MGGGGWTRWVGGGGEVRTLMSLVVVSYGVSDCVHVCGTLQNMPCVLVSGTLQNISCILVCGTLQNMFVFSCVECSKICCSLL